MFNTSYLIADLPNPERPRERMLRLGVEALSDRELLAVLLRSGTRGKSVLTVAAELLQKFDGSLKRLASAQLCELSKIHGIGPVKALELNAAFTLAKRLTLESCIQQPQMTNPENVARYVREKLRQREQEEFHALLLDTRMRLIRDEVITIGLLDRSLVHAREVFRGAIKEACQTVIICHNHPSGDITPSQEDLKSTRMLQRAGQIIGISILDHVIIGSSLEDARFFSFRQENLLLKEHEMKENAPG
ncbi:MAG: DNA repair protein RadC [Lentisphaeria bacterium]